MSTKTDSYSFSAKEQAMSWGGELIYGFAETSLGEICLAKAGEQICWIGLSDEVGRGQVENRLKRYMPNAVLRRDDVAVNQDIQDMLAAWEKGNNKPLQLFGTPFQQKVWQALLRIPKGKTVSYQDIANDIGNPKAVRAVGSAIGANPISILVPCHRVIHKDGSISHYAWGKGCKEKLLKAERAI